MDILLQMKIWFFNMDDRQFLWIGKNNNFDCDKFYLFLNYRYPTLKLFVKAINKPARVDLVPIRISEQLRLEQMDIQFEKYIYKSIVRCFIDS